MIDRLISFPTQLYQHFKGGLYDHIAEAEDKDRQCRLTVYYSHTHNQVMVRPASEFHRPTDRWSDGVVRPAYCPLVMLNSECWTVPGLVYNRWRTGKPPETHATPPVNPEVDKLRKDNARLRLKLRNLLIFTEENIGNGAFEARGEWKQVSAAIRKALDDDENGDKS